VNGNVTALIDVGQVIAARYIYDPYGSILSATGPMAEGNRYRFSSMEQHEPSHVDLYKYREYEATLQRWIHRDPIEENGGFNTYAFVFNSPISHVDPFGLDVDLNLFNPDNHDCGFQNAKKIAHPPGIYIVAGHGSPLTVGDSRSGKEIQLDPKDLAKIIKADPRYKPGMPVRLMACLTGKEVKGTSKTFAKALAEELNAVVFAPNENIGIQEGGGFTIAPFGRDGKQNLHGPGTMVQFQP